MRFFAVFILICLLLTGTVAAIAADNTAISGSTVSPGTGPGIYTLTAYTDCSDDSAQVGTPAYMGELNVDSIPDGASVSLDGSPWTYSHCVGGLPSPTCFHLPINTPYKSSVETGTHPISIQLDGYRSYSGTVKICSQKVSYVHKTLTLAPATTTTKPTTAVTTTVTTAAATTPATTAEGAATTARSPGFEAVTGLAALGAILFMQKGSGR